MDIIQEEQEIQFNPEDYTLEEILKPKNCALLVVDMQNDYLHKEGFFAKRLKTDIKQMQSIVPNIQKLIDAAHDAGVLVIFTQGSEDVKFRKPGPDLRRAVSWKENDGDGSVNSQRGSFGWEFYGVKPTEKDIIVEKHKWSAFDGKDKDGKSLKEILDERGLRTLIVAGVVAETCIETTLRDAYSKDYFTVIPEKSVGSNDSNQRFSRMIYWGTGFLGDVVEENEIKKIWSRED